MILNVLKMEKQSLCPRAQPTNLLVMMGFALELIQDAMEIQIVMIKVTRLDAKASL